MIKRGAEEKGLRLKRGGGWTKYKRW